MFFSAAGPPGGPRIVRATLSGRQQTVLANTDLLQPTSLTLDFDEDYLYWADRAGWVSSNPRLASFIQARIYPGRHPHLASSIQACIYPGRHPSPCLIHPGTYLSRQAPLTLPHSSRHISIQACTPHLASSIQAFIYPGSHALPHSSRHVYIQATTPCLASFIQAVSIQTVTPHLASSIQACIYPGSHTLPCLASSIQAGIFPGSLALPHTSRHVSF